MSSQPPILNIQMVPAGVNLVIGALRKLPHDQVDDLVQEIWAQYKAQMQALAEATLTDSGEEKGSQE
jgi:hypothetical protein